MKLTKKLLAILLSVAMLAGMVAVGVSASELPQLDPNVPTLDIDCLEHDPVNNPYKIKLGFKLYKVNAADHSTTLLEDSNPNNDTYDVNVKASDIIKVELWCQTNFFMYGLNTFIAYDNAFITPAKNGANGYATYAYYGKLGPAVAAVYDKATMDDSAADGTFANPYLFNSFGNVATGIQGHTYAASKQQLPSAWRGTGVTAKNFFSTTAVDDFGNKLAKEDGTFRYNFNSVGVASTATDLTLPGFAAVFNVYQPLYSYNLVINSDATDGSVANLFIPDASIKDLGNTATGNNTWCNTLDTQAVYNDMYFDPTYEMVAQGGNISKMDIGVTYGDDTTAYDKVWDIENVTITVGDAPAGGEDDTTTEPPTTEAPKVPCNYAALDAAIAAAKAADKTNCTSASITALNNALTAAEAVERNMIVDEAGANQKAIDDATAALNAAVAGLTKLGTCNYAALDAAIAAAKAADKTNCTSASITALNNALTAAEAVERNMIADEAGANQAKIDAAVTALNAAVAGLTKLGTCNYAALDAAIAAAKAADKTNCTSASITALNNALAAAEAVERNMIADEAGANQAKIDAAVTALNAAVAGLTKLGACDYDALDAAIAAYDALDKAEWTPASWTASDVDAKYAAAKAIARDLVADEAGANQATITAAAEALDAAIKALVAVADKADLAAAIAGAPSDEDAYTPNSWAPFAAALAAANEVNADANATQEAVDAAVADLADAMNNLVRKADKAALAEAIAGAEALDEADYTPDSWAAANLANMIAAAKLVNDDANASEADVEAAIQSLRDAALVLVEKADTEALEEAIATLPAIAEDDADPATWAAYEAALAAAELVFADANATQDEVDKAEADLLAAISAVKEKDVVYCDYSDLDDAIAAFEDLDAAAYTPNSYNAVKAYYDAAKAIARNLEYTEENQEAIDNAYDALNNAMIRDLVKVADKTALKAAIDTVVDTANCTSASIAKYEAALADANAVYADANATQQAVDAAKDALVAAQTLEKLPKIDYTDLKDAMAKFEALDAAEWTDDSYAAAKAAYDVAADLVEEDLYDDEAGVNAIRVDEATDALDTAIGALKAAVKKDALLAEINKAASIEEDLATDATWADYANALANAQDVYADDAATQEDVDDATAELAAANAALALRDLVDYTALDAALALVPAEAQDAYTPASWQAYANAKAAAEKVDRALVDNKAGTNQKLVNDAAAKLKAAYEALKINAANITNVAYDNTDYFAPATLAYAFTVNGAPSKIQVLSPDGGTMTFDRRSTKVNIVSYNANNEVVDYADEDPAYEIWTINLVLKADDYQVRAKYDYTWDTEYFDFTVEYDEYDTKTATFAASVAGAEAATAVEAAKGEVITFTAVTDATAIKVQFMFADGGTSTYSQNKSVDNGDGTRTWTITRVFSRSQDINLRVKAPTGWGESIGNVVVTIK